MDGKGTLDDLFGEFEAWLASGQIADHHNSRCPFDKKPCRKDCAAYGNDGGCRLIPPRP